MVDNINNPMKELRIEKITLNIGVGEAGDRLEKAETLLQRISGTKIVKTTAKKRIPTWNLRLGLPIGVKTTIRGKKAEELLKKLFISVENRVKPSNFDKEGNLSFGIKEYTHIPDVKYDPKIGVIGLDVCVTVKRKGGNRTKNKAYRPAKIGKKHRISIEESQEFFKKKFGLEIAEKFVRKYY
jgi:large subunit ribosomal protein L5